jgi:hypothetical protein
MWVTGSVAFVVPSITTTLLSKSVGTTPNVRYPIFQVRQAAAFVLDDPESSSLFPSQSMCAASVRSKT